MRKYFSFLTAALLLAASSCSPPPAASIDLEAEEAALHEAADAFHAAARPWMWRSSSHYASDVLLLPPGGDRMQGSGSGPEVPLRFRGDARC